MDNACIHNLKQIEGLLLELPDEFYSKKLAILDNQSIGSHTRHVLEFYLCLLKGLKLKSISYDARERDLGLELSKDKAMRVIDILCAEIAGIYDDIPIELISDHSENKLENITLKTSLYRELRYNLEHSVHHLALIKIALKEMGFLSESMATLGVASSTLRYRDQNISHQLHEAE